VVISEYFERISLREMINEKRKNNEMFPKKFIFKIFTQIISELFYCYSLNFIRENISPEYILVNSDNKIKLICFRSSFLPDPKISHSIFNYGIKVYRSPKIILNKGYTSFRDI
jgi:serine/threonine protein kinase